MPRTQNQGVTMSQKSRLFVKAYLDAASYAAVALAAAAILALGGC